VLGFRVNQSPGRFQHLGTVSLPVPLAAHIVVVALIVAAPAALTLVVTVIVAVAFIIIIPSTVAAAVPVSALSLVFLFCSSVSISRH
jgi:hypothetical protein